MAHVEEALVYDTVDSFALRVKYKKHVVFVPVEPSMSYESVVSTSLAILAKSDASPPEEQGYSSFDQVNAEDAALFLGSTSLVGGASQETMRYAILDRSQKSTVAKMGFKDGADAVAYLGFRANGSSSRNYSDPNVSLPSLVDDEEEGEDPDAIPPPLDADRTA